jgi:F-type H+-transporting ATPase subunit epsilon
MTLISDKQFHVEVITPERLRFGGEALMLSVPGVEGQMGLLANHAPILALLQPGRLTLQTRERTMNMAVGEGFVKMSNNRAVCLVDFAEQSDEIDRAKAESQRAELERELATEASTERREEIRRRLKAELARIEVAATRGA